MQGLDSRRILDLLGGDPFIRQLVVLESTASTNDDVHRLATEQQAPEGTVVIADHQTAGRGRRSRAWYSPQGLGVYLSVLFRPSPFVTDVTRWTVASALAACEACRETTGSAIVIKWPNDLYFGTLKLAGTLAELRSSGPMVAELVVGTGFNVNQLPQDFPEPLRERAGSLRMSRAGRPVEREHLIAAYLLRLGRIAEATAGERWPEIQGRFLQLAPGAIGKRVHIVRATAREEDFDGITRGLDSTGALRVERQDGAVVSVYLPESVIPLES